jgi:hypothetical protein
MVGFRMMSVLEPAVHCRGLRREPQIHRFDASQSHLYSWGMEVHFSPEVETRLQQLTVTNGTDAEGIDEGDRQLHARKPGPFPRRSMTRH